MVNIQRITKSKKRKQSIKRGGRRLKRKTKCKIRRKKIYPLESYGTYMSHTDPSGVLRKPVKNDKSHFSNRIPKDNLFSTLFQFLVNASYFSHKQLY